MISKKEYNNASKIVNRYKVQEEENLTNKIIEENRKYIGTTWKMRNSYGSPDEGWWEYVEVIGQDNRELKFIVYAITSDDKASVKEESSYNYYQSGMGSSYFIINRREFEKGRDEVLEKLGLKSK